MIPIDSLMSYCREAVVGGSYAVIVRIPISWMSNVTSRVCPPLVFKLAVSVKRALVAFEGAGVLEVSDGLGDSGRVVLRFGPTGVIALVLVTGMVDAVAPAWPHPLMATMSAIKAVNGPN